MSDRNQILAKLKEIEENANEMARILIEVGFPIAVRAYGKAIAMALMEVNTLTRPKAEQTITLQGDTFTAEQLVKMFAELKKRDPPEPAA